MNSALRLRSMPGRLLRRRYGAIAVLSKQVQPSYRFDDAKKQWSTPILKTTSRRSFHSSVVLYKDYPEHTLLPMPALSPTMEMGTIANWELKEGDSFSAGAVFCSVETDKATMDFEAQDDGVIAKILREPPNASDIPIGAPICVVVEDEEDVAAFADYVLEEEPAATPSESSEPAAATTSTESASSAPAPSRDVSDENVLLPAARFLAESK